MALTQETLDFLKFVPVVKNLPKRAFLLLYDAEADVLYIDFHNPPQSSDETELTEEDIPRPSLKVSIWLTEQYP